jgi:hypothetical protein
MLTPDVMTVLWLVFLLQSKHFICDGPLQTKAMVDAKSTYGKPIGMSHAAIHGLGTLVILPWFGIGVLASAGLAIADAFVHYHIDFSKENLVRRSGWTVKDAQFWWALVGDQYLHGVTYLAVAGTAVSLLN